MTDAEQAELVAWFDAIREKQPAGTLAVVAIVRDGLVQVAAPLYREFPNDDFEAAAELIAEELSDLPATQDADQPGNEPPPPAEAATELDDTKEG